MTGVLVVLAFMLIAVVKFVNNLYKKINEIEEELERLKKLHDYQDKES